MKNGSDPQPMTTERGVIRAVDVVKQTAQVDDKGNITEFRVTMHVAFEVEHQSHLIGTGQTKS